MQSLNASGMTCVHAAFLVASCSMTTVLTVSGCLCACGCLHVSEPQLQRQAGRAISYMALSASRCVHNGAAEAASSGWDAHREVRAHARRAESEPHRGQRPRSDNARRGPRLRDAQQRRPVRQRAANARDRAEAADDAEASRDEERRRERDAALLCCYQVPRFMRACTFGVCRWPPQPVQLENSSARAAVSQTPGAHRCALHGAA
jgi:hypothetical protein